MAKKIYLVQFEEVENLEKICEKVEAFEKEKGYPLKAEYIVDEGYFNNPFRIPTKEFLDFLDIINELSVSH